MSKTPAVRLSREARRDKLIRATYQCIAERGLERTKVRDVAEYAGVAYGLIRHYFANKEELIEATYSAITAEIHQHAHEAAAQAGPRAADKLAAFIAACMSEPMTSTQYLSFWSCFVSRIIMDPHMAALHEREFLGFRRELTTLIQQSCEEAGSPLAPDTLTLSVIKANAIIDGLWMEVCLNAKSLPSTVLIQAGIESVGALLEIELVNRPHGGD